MIDRHNYVTGEILPDGTVGEITAHTEVNGKVLPPPMLDTPPGATTEGLERLLDDILAKE